jgi:hypothetical protein
MVLYLPKNDVTKILGSFDARNVPESQKHAKQKKIYFAVLKPNERGLVRIGIPNKLQRFFKK